MKLAVLLSTLVMLSHSAMSQFSRQWEAGFSGLTGRNFYDRKYFDQPQLPPGRTSRLKSNYLFGAGLWVEKHLSQRISAISELRYTEVDVPTNFLCECGYTGSVILQDEKHYWGSLEAGLRYYLNRRAALLIYAEGKAAGDWFIAAREKRNDKVSTDWDVMGYSHLVPGLSFAIGAKWKRLGVSLGGNTNVARTIVRNIGVHNKVSFGMRTGILSRGLFTKVSFTLFKPK